MQKLPLFFLGSATCQASEQMFRAAPIKAWPVSHMQDRDRQSVNVRTRTFTLNLHSLPCSLP